MLSINYFFQEKPKKLKHTPQKRAWKPGGTQSEKERKRLVAAGGDDCSFR